MYYDAVFGLKVYFGRNDLYNNGFKKVLYNRPLRANFKPYNDTAKKIKVMKISKGKRGR